MVIAKVLHAIPAWSALNLLLRRTGKNLTRFIRRRVRLRFYSHDDPTMAELADELDETLFTAVLNNDDHVLRYILPDRRNNTYSLRPKRHEIYVGIRRDYRNFFQRPLFKDTY